VCYTVIRKGKEITPMKDYLFIDQDTGEEFFVECKTLDEAWEIVEQYFDIDFVDFIDEYTVEEAEILGYDTY
jgi:hypothetical protein